MGEDRAWLSPRLSCLSFPLFEGFFADLRAAAPFEFSHPLTREITDNRQKSRPRQKSGPKNKTQEDILRTANSNSSFKFKFFRMFFGESIVFVKCFK